MKNYIRLPNAKQQHLIYDNVQIVAPSALPATRPAAMKWRCLVLALCAISMLVGLFVLVPALYGRQLAQRSGAASYHGFCAVPYDMADMDEAMLQDIRSVSMENLMAAAERGDLLRYDDNNDDDDDFGGNRSGGNSEETARRDSDGDGLVDAKDMMVERLLRSLFMERFDVGTPFEIREGDDGLPLQSHFDFMRPDDDDFVDPLRLYEPAQQRVVEKSLNASEPIIDEGYLRVTVPRFRDGRNGRFLHDFRFNQSLIVDKEQSHCFVMPMDRSTVMEPRSLQELIVKLNDGSFVIDTEVVRRNMYVVMPALSDLSGIAPRILKECTNMSIYRLEEKTGHGERMKILYTTIWATSNTGTNCQLPFFFDNQYSV